MGRRPGRGRGRSRRVRAGGPPPPPCRRPGRATGPGGRGPESSSGSVRGGTPGTGRHPRRSATTPDWGQFEQGPVRHPGPEACHRLRVHAVDDRRGDRTGVAVDLPGFQDAELVALRVREDGPRDVALAHVGRRRAEGAQAGDQLRLVGRGGGGEVEVEAVLGRCLGVGTGTTSMPRPTGSGQTRPPAGPTYVVTPGLKALQPSASAQNRPTAGASTALMFTWTGRSAMPAILARGPRGWRGPPGPTAIRIPETDGRGPGYPKSGPADGQTGRGFQKAALEIHSRTRFPIRCPA